MGSDSCPPRLADEVGTRMGVEVDDHLRRVRVRARARAGVRGRVRARVRVRVSVMGKVGVGEGC